MSRMPESEDEAVRGTNDDAAQCKLSAVALGYWDDPHLKSFVKRAERRQPLINRGYWTRVAAMHSLLRQFFRQWGDSELQIVNLGAGFDTMFWQLHTEHPHARFFELDFDEVVTKKCSAVHGSKLLKAVFDGDSLFKNTGVSITSKRYHLLSADLRSLESIEAALVKAGINTSLPTMFYSECVLIYLPPRVPRPFCGGLRLRSKTPPLQATNRSNPTIRLASPCSGI
eukprot:Opistho-2@79824